MAFHGIPWNKGTKGLSKSNATSFKPGNIPWTAGKAGTGAVKSNRGSFGHGINPAGGPLAPLGARRFVRSRGEVCVKVADPHPYQYRRDGKRRLPESGSWRPLRLLNFEAANGPLPTGCVVRRLLPLCDCVDNLVLVTNNINARLNHGSWCRPRRPWRTLPLDRDVRLTAVVAALAQAAARERMRVQVVPCACGCNQPIDRIDKHGFERRYKKGHAGHASRRET